MNMRRYQGKRLLSLVRQGDYAHAGEEEALDLAFSKISNKSANILDIGSGLGGSAAYIKNLGYQHITGVDIEPEAIEYAKATYSDISFFCGDVHSLSQQFAHQQFDLIYLFNSFYSFEDQNKALTEMNLITKPEGLMILFDYSDRGQNFNSCNQDALRSKPFIPIHLKTIKNELVATGWTVLEIIDLTAEYLRWYKELVAKLKLKHHLIIQHFDEKSFNLALSTYQNFVEAFSNKSLGGTLIYAKRQA